MSSDNTKIIEDHDVIYEEVSVNITKIVEILRLSQQEVIEFLWTAVELQKENDGLSAEEILHKAACIANI